MEDIMPEEVVEATARNRRDACCLVVFRRIRRALPALVEKRLLESTVVRSIMPAAVARKAGKRSVSKAKQVKNLGRKRTKGVCMPTVPSSAHFKRMCCGNTARTRSHARLCPGKLCGRQLLGSGPINKSSNATG